MLEIEFIGHSGFALRHQGFEILVDPWLTPSSFETPVLKSFLSSHQTIDYLIPEVEPNHAKYNPDFILCSHFHTHHAPQQDIARWMDSSSKSISLVGPQMREADQTVFDEVKARYPTHQIQLFDRDFEIQAGPFKILGLTHTIPNHFSYFVLCGSGSFLHIADAKANRIYWDRRLDPLWRKYADLNPSFLAMSGGAMSSRHVSEDGYPYILENAFMSPVEAANLTGRLAPKAVGLMGMFNFSVWKSRLEYAFSPVENESYFHWALKHLAPSIRSLVLRPGQVYQIENHHTVRQVVSAPPR